MKPVHRPQAKPARKPCQRCRLIRSFVLLITVMAIIAANHLQFFVAS